MQSSWKNCICRLWNRKRSSRRGKEVGSAVSAGCVVEGCQGVADAKRLEELHRQMVEQEMNIAKYLLDIEEFLDTENGEALLERASLCVDEERKKKAERMGTLSGKAACLGAGLLLQFAVEETLKGDGGSCPDGLAGVREMCGSGLAGMDAVSGSDFVRTGAVESVGLKESGTTAGVGMVETDMETNARLTGKNAAAVCGSLQVYSVKQLLVNREGVPPKQFVYRYGKHGKPYFANLPFYFNLSHSGHYVLCGLSMEEIGADIQEHCGRKTEKLARRFYSECEIAALEQAGEARDKLFYRLWTRKEAYGKLTGEGVAGLLGMALLPGVDVAGMLRMDLSSGTALTEGSEEADTISGSNQAVVSCMLLGNQEAVSVDCPDIRTIMYETMFLPDGRRLVWEECSCVEGYSIAFCRYG